MTRDTRLFAARALIAAAVAIVALLVLGLLWYAAQVLLIVFAGLLLAVALGGLADRVAARTRLGRGVALAVVVLALAVVTALGVWALADDVAEQTVTVIETLPRALDNVRDALGRTAAGRVVLGGVPEPEQMLEQAPRVVGVTVGTSLGLVTNLVLLGFVALYVAADPALHVRGLTALVPRRQRPRAVHLFATLGGVLRRWLLGKLVGMVIIGVVTWAGLALLGVPLSLAFGVFAGLLNFVPYVGPLISAVPAVLLTLLDAGFGMAGWVIVLYLGVQTLEGYILTPLIDRQTVDTPPALLLTSQVIAGVTLGALGVVLAAPLLVVALVVVKLLYVEDVLGEDVDVQGEPPSEARAA
jgi:predicted PurR-regulated permease PerM